MKYYLAIPLALVLAGCVGDVSTGLRNAAIAYISQLQASGVDVIELDEGERGIAMANCSLAVAVVTVWNPTVPDAPQGVMDFCDVLAAAIADNPVEPIPVPRPDGQGA